MNGEAALVKEIADFDKNLLDLETKRWNLDHSLKNNQQLIFDHNNAILNGSKEIEKSQQRQEFLKQRIVELQKLITRKPGRDQGDRQSGQDPGRGNGGI